MKPLQLMDLGVREYGEVYELQKSLLLRRIADEIDDTLIFVEHPHVVTVGRRLDAQKNIFDRSMPVVEIERGGDVTYHGPGQLVGYPILKLEGSERDLHGYLRRLEDALISTATALGLPGGRNPGWTGMWLGEKKVASIGIAVRRWVTFHGFALNVCTDLQRFSAIQPCGLPAVVMTSLEAALGRPITVDEVKPLVAAGLSAALQRELRRET